MNDPIYKVEKSFYVWLNQNIRNIFLPNVTIIILYCQIKGHICLDTPSGVYIINS